VLILLPLVLEQWPLQQVHLLLAALLEALLQQARALSVVSLRL
jgi:hypothetical protein